MRGAFGSGASGSCTINARLFAPWGAPPKRSSGETSFPSQVFSLGISEPLANAGELIVRAMAASAPGTAHAAVDEWRPPIDARGARSSLARIMDLFRRIFTLRRAHASA